MGSSRIYNNSIVRIYSMWGPSSYEARQQPWLFKTILTNIGSAAYWQLVDWAIALITQYVHTDYLILTSGLQSLIMLVLNTLLVVGTRFILFEGIYKNKEYVSPRKQRDHEDLFSYPYETFWFLLGWFCMYNMPIESQSFEILTFKEHVQLCFLWILTDCWFASYHYMNHCWFYGPKTLVHHKEHHAFAKPTSWQPVDHFTTVDGSGHVLCYLIASAITQFGVFGFSQKIYFMAMFQWMIAGQIHHGGKDIDANIICGLEFVRRALGFHVHMAKLHDIHHTDTHYNFGMTGLFDEYVLGTYREVPAEHAKRMKASSKKKQMSTTYNGVNETVEAN